MRGESIFVYFVKKQNGGDVRKETQFNSNFLQIFSFSIKISDENTILDSC